MLEKKKEQKWFIFRFNQERKYHFITNNLCVVFVLVIVK